MYDFEREGGEPIERHPDVVHIEGFSRRRRQPQRLVDGHMLDAHIDRRFEQRRCKVFTVEPPALTDAVVEEGRGQLEPIDAEILDLPLQLRDRDLVGRRQVVRVHHRIDNDPVPDHDLSFLSDALNRGGRFSRAAAMPSLRSSVWLIVATPQKLKFMALMRSRCQLCRSCCLVASSASRGSAAMRAASAVASVSNASGATTRLTRPISNARWASLRSPPKASSAASQ